MLTVNLHRHAPVASVDPDGVRMLTFVWTCNGEEVLTVALEDRPGRTFDRALTASDQMAVCLAEACIRDHVANRRIRL